MSGLKDLAKNGWHPKGQGGKESWRGDFKGVNTVAGWMGKGKDSMQTTQEHQAAPLSTLKDPASFGPPPKRTLHAAPDSSSRGVTPTHTRQSQQDPKVEDESTPLAPYRANTGLRTEQQPRPPVRSPVPGTAKPKLPPRLPPRQDVHPNASAPTPPPTYNQSMQDSTPAEGYLNQGALDRLGRAGISVPGLGISGTTSSPNPPHRNASPSDPASSPALAAGHGPQLGELQARFTKMPTHLSRAEVPATISHTESSSTATHGPDQQATARSGTTNAFGQKFDVANIANSTIAAMTPPPTSQTHGSIAKKPPPPPPKKRELTATTGAPPPVPLGSKPKF